MQEDPICRVHRRGHLRQVAATIQCALLLQFRGANNDYIDGCVGPPHPSRRMRGDARALMHFMHTRDHFGVMQNVCRQFIRGGAENVAGETKTLYKSFKEDNEEKVLGVSS